MVLIMNKLTLIETLPGSLRLQNVVKRKRGSSLKIPTLEAFVSVYKIKDLTDPKTCFKLDVNAQENRLLGVAVISDGITVVVVEGGKKSINRYGKRMLKRIDWAAAIGNGEEGAENNEIPVNSCGLVWQGSVARPSFQRFIIHQCRTEAAAKKVFADAGVPHYWDLALNFTEEQIHGIWELHHPKTSTVKRQFRSGRMVFCSFRRFGFTYEFAEAMDLSTGGETHKMVVELQSGTKNSCYLICNPISGGFTYELAEPMDLSTGGETRTMVAELQSGT